MVDDTLCKRSGPHFWGAGMHHDPLRSTYGKKVSKRWFTMAFGHNWVVLAIWIPLPWNPIKGVAVPILWRLYRPKKRCQPSQYRTKTCLASELVGILSGWMPVDKKAVLVADNEYACKTVLRGLPPNMDFVGPILMKAAFFDYPKRQPCRGRRLKGKRLFSPVKLARTKTVRWKKLTVAIYGKKEVKIMVKSQVGMWYSVTYTRPVRMVITHDPRGRFEDRAYFTTDMDSPIEEILTRFSKRWELECTFRNSKQELGLEDPQNGWWRRKKKLRNRKKKPGPQPKGRRGEIAIRHTVPLIFCVHAIILVWYFKNGNFNEDVDKVIKSSPWYRHKTEPSFADMVNAARRELVKGRIMAYPSLRRVRENIFRLFPVMGWTA